MKTTLLSALLLTLGFTACVAPAQPTYRDYDEYGSDYDRNRYDDYGDYDEFDEYAYRDFYDGLNPHGRWMNYPEYGQVWAPNAGPDFMPYSTNGYWTYTNFGWTWVSNYAWGWGPFHYGRWFFDDRFGWLWRPGRQWAPAWVAWGQTNGYYGWAPLFPGININVNIGFNRFPRRYWTFVPCQHLYSRNWRGYAVRNNTTIINNNVTIINNYGDRNGRPSRDGRGGYWRGPQVQDVERYGNTRIRPMVIENTNRPGSTRVDGDRVTVYRPNTRPGNAGGGFDRPSRGETSNNDRPVTRPGNRYERPDDQPGVTRPGSTWDRPSRSGETRSDETWRNSPSRSNEDFNRNTQPADQPVTRPNNGWERPQRSETTRPNVERPDWNSNSRNPERQPGMTRPGYGDQSRSNDSRPAEGRPEVTRPAGRSDESGSRTVERPNWGSNRGGDQPSRSQAPSGEVRQQSSGNRESAPAGRSDGGNSSSGGGGGRSRGPR